MEPLPFKNAWKVFIKIKIKKNCSAVSVTDSPVVKQKYTLSMLSLYGRLIELLLGFQHSDLNVSAFVYSNFRYTKYMLDTG